MKSTTRSEQMKFLYFLLTSSAMSVYISTSSISILLEPEKETYEENVKLSTFFMPIEEGISDYVANKLSALYSKIRHLVIIINNPRFTFVFTKHEN